VRDILRSQPRSSEANDAYNILSKIYLRTGQYSRFLATYKEWALAFPDSAELLREKENDVKFRGRPNQVNGPVRRSSLQHDDDSLSLPVSVNGKPGEYLFDTGAWQSAMTELEAKRLGLTVREGSRTLIDSSGTKVQFRTAVANEVRIGGMRFRDVSFAVVPAPPWAPDAEVGVIGMPILVHMRTIKWLKDGTIELGGTDPQPAASNLVFHEHRVLLRASVLGRTVLTTFDTGATTTDLNANFATMFADVVDRDGTRGTEQINGIGGTQTFESIKLPELIFTIGSRDAALRPAQITLQRIAVIGGECCVGNAGRDLLTHGSGFRIDFSTMTLSFE
jgi:predicted aspartyl protease